MACMRSSTNGHVSMSGGDYTGTGCKRAGSDPLIYEHHSRNCRAITSSIASWPDKRARGLGMALSATLKPDH